MSQVQPLHSLSSHLVGRSPTSMKTFFFFFPDRERNINIDQQSPSMGGGGGGGGVSLLV